MSALRFLPLVLAAIIASCASSDGGKPAARTAEPASATSPLGLGYPDPQAIMDQVLARMESQDFEGLCALLAGPRKSDGAPVPLVPGKNVHERRDIWVPLEELKGMRDFLARRWKTFHWGRPRNLRNEPPLVAVTVRVTYAWDAIPPAERELLVRTWTDRHGQPVTWEEIVTEMRARERAEALPGARLPSLGFVHLDGRWRLYLGPVD